MIRPNAEGTLWIYTVYRRPSDYPNHFVVRPWVVVIGNDAEPFALRLCRLYTHYEDVVEACTRYHLTRLDRQPGDDPAILETWL